MKLFYGWVFILVLCSRKLYVSFSIGSRLKSCIALLAKNPRVAAVITAKKSRKGSLKYSGTGVYPRVIKMYRPTVIGITHIVCLTEAMAGLYFSSLLIPLIRVLRSNFSYPSTKNFTINHSLGLIKSGVTSIVFFSSPVLNLQY